MKEDNITIQNISKNGQTKIQRPSTSSIEVELSKTNAKLEAIFNVLPNVLVILNIDGSIIDFKSTSLNDFHFNQKELIGKKIEDIMPADISKRFYKAVFESVKLNKISIIDYTIKVNGKTNFYEARLLPYTDDRIVTVIRNITEFQKAQNELKKSERRFRSVWENSLEGMRLTDENGIIISVNKAFCNLVGEDESNLVGKTFNYFYVETDGIKHESGILYYKTRFSSRKLNHVFEAELRLTNGKNVFVEVINNFIDSYKDENVDLTEKPLLLTIFRDITNRKKAEEALKKSEERFRTLIENINEVFHIVTFEGDKKKQVYVSHTYEEIWGRTCLSLYTHPNSWMDLIHPDDKEKVNDALKNQQKSGYFVEYRIIRDDKQLRWIRDRGYPVKDGNDNATQIVGFAEDITEKKIAEEEKRQSIELNRSLVETSPDAIVLMDLEGNILMSNNHVASLFGFTNPSETIGLNAINFVSKDFQKKFKRDAMVLFRKHNIRNREYVLINKSGETFPAELSASIIFDENKKPKTYVGVIRDISQRKISEEALKYSEMQFRSIWENSNDGMRLTDSKGIIVTVNTAFCKIFETNKEDLIGKPYFDVYSEKTNKESAQMLLEYQKNFFNNKFVTNKRSNRILSSGKAVALDISYSIIQFENGKSLLLGIFRDISVQIKAEEDLRKSEKLAAIGKMTAFLSHEIKTPLVSINMNIDMLSKSLDLPESKKKSFSIIQKEVKRLDKLLRNVLQYSRQVELINSNVNLANLIQNIKDFLEPILIERKISFNTHLTDCIIMGDYQKLQSAFLHLIENAIEAINEDGNIIISIDLNEQSETASITIADDGPGFDEGINIFEPFFTTKSSGTGLGLPIAQKIIEQHSGKLKLLSSNPGSTIFEISFNLYN